ncbi:small conductance mechanosensitive channel [Bacteroides heparinolyticus]|uniref:Small conductance mechanosensitive channel n=1 Tax=Prevotella heparinolytica TaxID=28113 RepID=A0A4R2LVY1_9BACE|nr:mechanosensitive ion channel domain-containing protein [Bacteroides heparinolyticus]TCO91155.1 small conductance mechanosensitive channel [Bacteroides heparinolyticus]
MLLPLLLSAITDQASELSFSKLQYLVEKMMGWGVDIGGRIISAAIIYFIGRILISLIKKFIAKVLVKRNIDAGIQSFVRSLVNILLTVLLVVAVIGKLGIETTSFAALLASAGVAIGMALSGNLQNFAGGLVILFLRPYKVGDWIESQGVSGTVREIQIFHTILTTADNKVIYIPNGALSSGTVINYSKEDTRRVDWVISVEYGEDYNKVEETVRRIIAADKRILNTPEPFLALHALADSSVNVVIRVWVKSQDYWGVYFDMNRIIYSEFNKEGISFPFPQLTVHQAKD